MFFYPIIFLLNYPKKNNSEEHKSSDICNNGDFYQHYSEQQILRVTHLSTIKEWLGKNHGTFTCCNFIQALKMKNPKKMCIYYTHAKVLIK